MLKRITGSMVRAVKVSMQNREVAFKVLACSALRRAISSLIQLTFLQSRPTVSKKYEHLVCVGGLTEKNEWRRIYPVPWKVFFGSKFKEKSWIEYEMQENVPFDHRPESRKVNLKQDFTSLGDEPFKGIKKRLDEKTHDT